LDLPKGHKDFGFPSSFFVFSLLLMLSLLPRVLVEAITTEGGDAIGEDDRLIAVVVVGADASIRAVARTGAKLQ
jgi:hypothetical protein